MGGCVMEDAAAQARHDDASRAPARPEAAGVKVDAAIGDVAHAVAEDGGDVVQDLGHVLGHAREHVRVAAAERLHVLEELELQAGRAVQGGTCGTWESSAARGTRTVRSWQGVSTASA